MTEISSDLSPAEEIGEDITNKLLGRVEAIAEDVDSRALKAEILSLVMTGLGFVYRIGHSDAYTEMAKREEES